MQELIILFSVGFALGCLYVADMYRRRLEAHIKQHKEEYWEVGEICHYPHLQYTSIVPTDIESVLSKLDDGTPVYIKLAQEE